jgi:hypothetical protein
MATDTVRLLDLLREAGDEAVTLDELAIAGVRDPARALHALEEAGHAVQRVRDNRFACVRLASAGPAPRVPAPDRPPAGPAPGPASAAPAPEPAPVRAPALPVTPTALSVATTPRIPPAAFLGGLALLAVVLAGGRRAAR